jgi:hypothetical protein
MSNLIDDYRTLTANVVKDPHLTRWLELLATTEKVLNKCRLSPAFGNGKNSQIELRKRGGCGVPLPRSRAEKAS